MGMYSLYKGMQAKTGFGKGVSTFGLLALSGVSNAAMYHVTSPNPVHQGRLGLTKLLVKRPLTRIKVVPGSHPIHSPLEDNWSIFDWLFYLIPDSLKSVVRSRVPTSSFEELNAMDLLHFQYNLVVILLVVSVFIIAYCYILITVLVYLKNNRESISSKSTLLGKLIPSDNLVNVLVILLKSCTMLNIVTSLVGLHFLFTKHFVFC